MERGSHGTLLDHDYADKKGIQTLYKIHIDLAFVNEDEFYNVYKILMEHYFDKYLSGEISFEEQRRIRMIELFSHYQIKITHEEADLRFKLYLKSFEQNWQCYSDVEKCLLSLNKLEKGIITEAGMRGIWLNRNHEKNTKEVEVIHSLSELRLS